MWSCQGWRGWEVLSFWMFRKRRKAEILVIIHNANLNLYIIAVWQNRSVFPNQLSRMRYRCAVGTHGWTFLMVLKMWRHFDDVFACCQLLSVTEQLFAAPWTVAHQALCPWDFLGKTTGVGCHFLLQEIFLT